MASGRAIILIFTLINMRKLHKEILTPNQAKLLPTLKLFSKDFGLVGGTAIALYIGHRESIDFDLFTKDSEYDFKISSLKRRFKQRAVIDRIITDEENEFTFVSNGIKVTFFNFDYRVPFTEKLDSVINMPTLLTLAAMKAFALGHRAKWKDYVDMYFIMRYHHPLSEIVARATKLFGAHFNEKLLRTQLAYFKDINYSEKIIYLPGFEESDKIIQNKLKDFSLE